MVPRAPQPSCSFIATYLVWRTLHCYHTFQSCYVISLRRSYWPPFLFLLMITFVVGCCWWLCCFVVVIIVAHSSCIIVTAGVVLLRYGVKYNLLLLHTCTNAAIQHSSRYHHIHLHTLNTSKYYRLYITTLQS